MFLSKHRLNIASLRIGKHCIVKNIASLRKLNIAHPYQRVALPEKINESSWILKQKVSQITYLTYEAGLVSISLKSSLVFDELKLSWRHDGSKYSPLNSALISARPSVEWHLFSYIKSSKTTLLREKFFLTWKWIIAQDFLTNKRDQGGERWKLGNHGRLVLSIAFLFYR